MDWENRFSTLVKESGTRIDEAKRRLQNVDTSKVSYLQKTSSYPALFSPAYKSSPQTDHDHIQMSSNLDRTGIHGDVSLSSSVSPSAALLHTLCDKMEQQNQMYDFLKTQVETLQEKLGIQMKTVENLKEQLSQLSVRVETYESGNERQSFKKWRSKFKRELSNVQAKACLHQTTDANNDIPKYNSTLSERNRTLDPDKNDLIVNSLADIRNRLDKIEVELGRNRHKGEDNSKMFEKNTILLMEWENRNQKSLSKLCEMQNLSNDEVKQLRSKLCNLHDKVHEMEAVVTGGSPYNLAAAQQVSNSSGDSVSLEDRESTRLHNSLSSEEDKISWTGSSVNLDGSDNVELSLEIDEFDNEVTRHNRRHHSIDSNFTDSSLNSLSGSANSLSDI